MCEELKRKLLSRIVIQDDGCWAWMGARITSGYGQICFNGRQLLTHRVSYEVHKGPITNGMVIRHSCDIPWCVNPDHLEMGTQQDNISDKVAKGRHAYGEMIGTAKLKEQDVLEIRELLSTGELLQYKIAERYGVDPKLITNIKHGRIWRHLLEPIQ
jgi:hypothetical protein